MSANSTPKADWAVHLPLGLTEDEVDLTPAPNLPSRWAARWRERGDAPVLRDIDGRWWTATELEERSRQAARRLLGSGLEPGQRLLAVAGSSGAFVVTYIGALRAGLTVVPVNPAYTRDEVARIVRAGSPAAAVVDTEQRASWVRAAAQSEVPIYGVELNLPDGSEAKLDQTRGDDPALLVYTSGTTGLSKGVPLTHAN